MQDGMAFLIVFADRTLDCNCLTPHDYSHIALIQPDLLRKPSVAYFATAISPVPLLTMNFSDVVISLSSAQSSCHWNAPTSHYSMFSMSAKPVTSNTSLTISLTCVTFMPPFLLMAL